MTHAELSIVLFGICWGLCWVMMLSSLVVAGNIAGKRFEGLICSWLGIVGIVSCLFFGAFWQIVFGSLIGFFVIIPIYSFSVTAYNLYYWMLGAGVGAMISGAAWIPKG